MATLFVLEQGAKVSKESRKIIVEKDREVLLDVPEFKIDRVFLFGNVQITTQALRFLLEAGKDISFFSLKGKFMGKVVSYASKNVYIRIKQYERFKDEDFCLFIVKEFVRAKLRNCRSVLQKYLRNHPQVKVDEEIGRLEELLGMIDRKTAINSLLGVEGMGSRIYFKGFSKMVRNEGFEFEGRNRHPPQDPVNSILSLGYSLITSEMFSVLSAVGLDPYVGYLHSLEYSRPSLALDLIEELRPAVIDRFALELINKRILKTEDFEEVRSEDGNAVKVLLSAESRRVYFQHYEKRMNATVFYVDENVTYRRLLESKVRNFVNVLEGKDEYRPFLLR